MLAPPPNLLEVGMSNTARLLIAMLVLFLMGAVGGVFYLAMSGPEWEPITQKGDTIAPTQSEEGRSDFEGLFSFALFWIAGIAAYFLPMLIAIFRRHHNAMAISLVNVVFGWTLLGWIVALIWSSTAIQQRG